MSIYDSQITPKVKVSMKYCKHCNGNNVFFNVKRVNESVASVCPNCDHINIIKEPNNIIEGFKYQTRVKEQEIINKLKFKNTRDLNHHCLITQHELIQIIYLEGRIPFKEMIRLKTILEYVLNYSKHTGYPINDVEYSDLKNRINSIVELRDTIQDLNKKAKFFDSAYKHLYFSYGTLRLIDSLHVFGIGTLEEVKDKQTIDYYEKIQQYQREIISKDRVTSLLQMYYDRDEDFLELYSVFYYAMQNYKEDRKRLHLNWISSCDFEVQKP